MCYISKNKCCICLEYNKICLSCKHCKEGVICVNCVSRVIESCPSCPICRQKSWYSQFKKTQVIPSQEIKVNVKSRCNFLFFIIHYVTWFALFSTFGYVTLILICSKDTYNNFQNWLIAVLSFIIGLLELTMFVGVCHKACGEYIFCQHVNIY